MKMKKYERPLNPLASWTDTSCSDDDESGDASFTIGDDVENFFRCEDEDEDDWKINPKRDLPSLHRIDRWQDDHVHKQERIQSTPLCCWKRKARSRRWYILFALAILLLALIWATIQSGLHRAKRSSDTEDVSLSEDHSLEYDTEEDDVTTTETGSSPVNENNIASQEISHSPNQVSTTSSPSSFPTPTKYEHQATSNPTVQESLLQLPTRAPSASPSIAGDSSSPTLPPSVDFVALPIPWPQLPEDTLNDDEEDLEDSTESVSVGPSVSSTIAVDTSSPTLPPSVQSNIRPSHPPQPQEESQNNLAENEQEDSESVASGSSPQSEEGTVVLQPNEYLAAGQFRSSPNEKYRLELTEDGDLVLTHQGSTDRTTIWSTETTGHDVRAYLQPDGNALLRNGQRATLWSSETHGYPGARLVLTDHGQLVIQTGDLSTSTVSTAVWMDGVPRDIYRGPAPTNADLAFPIRGAFYYP
jgi:septal ring-binding cell division protein DamX